MGTIKRKKFLDVLKRISNKGDVEISEGGRHLKVECIRTGEVYPIPVAHSEVNRRIVKKFKKWLEERNIRGAEEIDSSMY